MNGVAYPRDWDLVWFARDAERHIAAFVTGGLGPVPRALLDQNFEYIDACNIFCQEVNESTVVVSHKLYPNMESFYALACRGVHVYDWCDVHRVNCTSGCYELICSPLRALLTSECSESLAARIGLVALDAVTFAGSTKIDLRGHLDVISPD